MIKNIGLITSLTVICTMACGITSSYSKSCDTALDTLNKACQAACDKNFKDADIVTCKNACAAGMTEGNKKCNPDSSED